MTQLDTKEEMDKPRRGLLVWGTAAAVAIAVAALILVLSGNDALVTQGPASPTEIGTAYAEAYANFDIDRAISYLAADTEPPWPGNVQGARLANRLREAQGFKFMLEPCDEVFSSAIGIGVRCPYDFHALRSDQMGLGPYSGSYFQFWVQDGEIASLSGELAIDEFSPQMWEPFALWVSENHPRDVAIMYTDATQTLERLTEESIQLWEQHTRSYAEEVRNN